MNIRTQLTFRYIGIVLLVLLAMYFYLSTVLKDSMSSHITSELEVQAALTREFLIEELPTQDNFTYALIDPLVDRLGNANNARVTFIDVDGVVWGDTERDGQALREMDNHLTRPEVPGKGRMLSRTEAVSETAIVIQHKQNFVILPSRYIAMWVQKLPQREKAL